MNGDAPPPYAPPSPSLVVLHVYDVTNAPSAPVNAAITAVNHVSRGLLGLGGVFHGGVEVYGEEWAYGACESGSGVYSIPRPRQNPMYSYRESVTLGITPLTPAEVRAAVAALSDAWPGAGYDLLTRNCVHFTEALAEALRVPPPPGWVNAAAGAADGVGKAAAGAAQAAKEAAAAAKAWWNGKRQ